MRRRHLLVSTVACLLWLIGNSPSRADPEAYPYSGRFLSTFTAALLTSSEALPDARTIRIPMISGRPTPANLDHRLEYNLYRQRGTAPLVFVLPGIGGDADSPPDSYLADWLYRRGNHVIVLVSPFTPQFTLSASFYGMPGWSRHDAKDIFETMVIASRKAREESGLAVSYYQLVGSSLGALQAAFIAGVDQDDQRLDLDAVALVNPPVNLSTSAAILDDVYAGRDRLSAAQKWRAVLRSGSFILNHRSAFSRNPAAYHNLQARVGLNEDELAYVVGKFMRTKLPDVILAVQELHDIGILSPAWNEETWLRRLAEADGMSFLDYINQIAWPLYSDIFHDGRTLQEAALHNGLEAALADLRPGGARVSIVHSENDFLLSGSDVDVLRGRLGVPMSLFLIGGHIGTLWFRPFHEALTNALAERQPSL